ncbi:hypothetical protein L195_g037023 [Trifolium pratense]|uniref:Uncharacterized protein n=1 Tax=Trifolium pratense TaxID=57577 RepID=A0A2K3LR45_TRIPR|nr:hypothetical protein L195_g037023 [Trifolium pratense]
MNISECGLMANFDLSIKQGPNLMNQPSANQAPFTPLIKSPHLAIIPSLLAPPALSLTHPSSGEFQEIKA